MVSRNVEGNLDTVDDSAQSVSLEAAVQGRSTEPRWAGYCFDVVMSLRFAIGRLNPYLLGGGGNSVFHPTRNAGGFVSGADTQVKGAFCMVAASTTH
jgi:hypothetical protein